MMSSLLSIVFLFVALVTISSDVVTASTERKFMRRPDSERELPPIVQRKLEETDVETFFTRSYTAVTSPKDITVVIPPNAQNLQTIQGSYFITYAGVYRSSSVELVSTFLDAFPLQTQDTFRIEVLQPKTIPSIDEDFTFGGKCTVTNARTLIAAVSHSCFYDLCLGSPTDCINIYAGTRFDFVLIPINDLRPFLVNINNNGLLDPEATGGLVRNLQNLDVGKPVSLDDDNDFDYDGNNGRAPLPPNFPGFVFGGIGRYQGIKGTFELITVAQRTPFPKLASTGSPTESPTLTEEPTDNNNRARDLSQEEEEDDNRELQRVNEDDDISLKSGVIVQKIFITSNQRLPLGPKAI